MTPVQVTVKYSGTETHVLEAKLVAPGLAVGYLDIPGSRAVWAVVHARSGLMILAATNSECATAMAYELAATGIDWTLPAADLQPAITITVNRARLNHRANGSTRYGGPVATGRGLADTAASPRPAPS